MSTNKKIVPKTFGSFGDIHPYMAIARELKAHGHDPLITTMSFYRDKIGAAGFRFASVWPNVPPPPGQNQELTKELGILLDRSHYAEKAKEVSDYLRQENGAAVACDLIEEILLDDSAGKQEGRELAYASGN